MVAILPLYRSYLRQVRLLPHFYLRHFFQIKARDEVEAILSTPNEDLRKRKTYTLQKRIRRIDKANNGDLKAFEHILDIAYGRVGKLKWELLEPLLSNPDVMPPEPIISGVEKSRPPVHSPELKALLTSPFARSSRPLNRNDLVTPRTLPARADPLSEDARLFGPLSKRREVNIRWRFFRSELKKVLPPLQVELPQEEEIQNPIPIPPRTLAMQNIGMIRDIQNLIGDISIERPKTRRERRNEVVSRNVSSTTKSIERHPSRWVRRRYRALLSRIPQLVYDPSSRKDPFKVKDFLVAHQPHDKKSQRMPLADATSMAWIEK